MPSRFYRRGWHEEDQFGGLCQASLYDLDDDWSRFEIARDEFERVWNSDR